MNKTALITGGSSGIGLSLAKVFAKNKYEVIITARKREDLEKVAADLRRQFDVDAKIYPSDLSRPEAPQQLFDWCKTQNINVDVLVNNAGFGLYGKFAESDLQKQLNLIDLNIRALTHLTGLFLREMLKRKNGKILNVGSTAAFQPGPRMATYYASKAYVLSFSQALRNELKSTGVSVTALLPGGTKTNFQNMQSDFNQTKLIKNMRLMSADRVAEVGFSALMKGKSYAIPGLRNKFLAFLAQISPRNLATKVSGWTLDK